MADEDSIPTLLPPRMRQHHRKRKDGTIVTYYYWDGRTAGRKDMSLGTNLPAALRLYAKCEAKQFQFPKKQTTKERRPGRRRRFDSAEWMDFPVWARQMFLNAERRAGELERAFTLDIETFGAVIRRANGRCELSGIPLEFDGGVRNPFAPSLDRIDSARGYEPDNVRIVCFLANMALGPWGEGPLMRFVESLYGTRSISNVERLPVLEGV